MLQNLKQFRKRWRRKQFLKNTVAAYTNPWAKVTKTLTDIDYNERLYLLSEKRFKHDVQSITINLINTTQIHDLSDVVKTALKTLLFDVADFPVSDEDLSSSLQPYQSPSTYNFPTSTKTHSNIDYIKCVLNQVLENELLVYGYQYDFIDDIVPILKSRYLKRNGTSDDNKSAKIIQTLWVLTESSLSEAFEAVELTLSSKLKLILGDNHTYTPSTPFKEPDDSFYQEHQTEYQQLITLKDKDDTKKVVSIWENVFEDLNKNMSKNPEDRNISLIHGYENNHHLLLRTIIALMKTGALKPEDPVLILGPRFVDEILFLREYVGLANTIGLDLRDEGGLIFKGDMHNMPFEDNHFKLIYGANVFEYAHTMRTVINEIVRVLQKPGYAMGILRSVRNTPNMPPIGTDISTPEAAVNMFYSTPHTVIAMDEGYADTSEFKDRFPSFAVKIDSTL